MQDIYIQDKIFDRIDSLTKAEYESCTFNNCNFANGNLSEFKFIDCMFKDCNLSLAKLENTAFRDVKFEDCKMLGLRFDSCYEFGLSFSFETCQLNHASFYKTKIKKMVFKNSQLMEIDFAEADLSSAIFENCNLEQAIFDQTILEKADFRTSYNYSIDPEINRIKKARFSVFGILGLLDKYDIDIEQNSQKIFLTPRIEILIEKKLMGHRLTMSLANNKTGELWKNFMPKHFEISNRVTNNLISMQVYNSTYFENFHPTHEFEKWATIEVLNFDKVPANMETFIFFGGLYAVFNYKGSSSDPSVF